MSSIISCKGGGSAPATQTQVSKPFAEQLPFVQRIFSEAQNQFNQGPQQFFPGELVAPFDPATLAAQSQQIGAAGFLMPRVGQGLNALSSALGPIDPANDPTVNAFADAATRPVERQLTEQLLPAIQSKAISEGAFGGSRQAITEGQAVRDATQAIADTRAGIFNNAFGQQLQQQRAALALAPQLFSTATLPASLLSEVGSQREGLAQAMLNADRERFDFNQNAEFDALARFSNLINQFSNSGSQTFSTGTAARPGGLQSGLAGALLGSQLAGIPGAAAFGLTGPIGAGIGAGLGLFGLL